MKTTKTVEKVDAIDLSARLLTAYFISVLIAFVMIAIINQLAKYGIWNEIDYNVWLLALFMIVSPIKVTFSKKVG
jgi:hypothetical protein